MSNTETLMEKIRTLTPRQVDEVLRMVSVLEASTPEEHLDPAASVGDAENEWLVTAMIAEYYRTANSPKTVEEAIRQAEARAKDPNRKPFSRHFGCLPADAFGDPVAYQRKLCDEWD